MTPRLRYYKNFDYESENTNDAKINQPNDEGNFTESQSEEYENFKSKNWLSNSNIIASLSDAKIKQSINHYKLLLQLLQNELTIRAFNTKPNLHFRGRKIFEGSELPKQIRNTRIGKINRTSESTDVLQTSTLKDIRRILKQLSLSKDAKRKLFDEWCSIINNPKA
jgi:hypothetical protein